MEQVTWLQKTLADVWARNIDMTVFYSTLVIAAVAAWASVPKESIGTLVCDYLTVRGVHSSRRQWIHKESTHQSCQSDFKIFEAELAAVARNSSLSPKLIV